ncbi:MAG: TIGR03809 family protein [Pseudolabrys sp.]|jgi:uncharacterized repeat protein (TIGR03809 family)
MQVSPGSPSLEKIAQRWHDLAEQRLAYYTELYRSGRWKHYYTQEGFAVRMLDVIEAAKKWRQLSGRQPHLPLPPYSAPAQIPTQVSAEATVRSAA